MKNTTTVKPNDSWGIIPVGSTHSWNLGLGPDIPTGGIYSTVNDLSKYLRSILNSQLLPESVTNAWLKPHSWASSRSSSAYGMPWEILRTTKATRDLHPIDIFTKAGALEGYFSTIFLIPEYGVGLTILTASPTQLALSEIQEAVVAKLIPLIDGLNRDRARQKYSGFYETKNKFSGENSSISIEVDDDGPGLRLRSWKLNGTDFLSVYGKLREMPEDTNEWQARLIPTNLFTDRNGKWSPGERWRLTTIANEKHTELSSENELFADFCITDIDGSIYGGWSLEEFNFHTIGDSNAVNLPAARTVLFKKKSAHSEFETDDQDEAQNVLKTEHEDLR